MRSTTFGSGNADNESDADFVIASRADSLLVFGSISPGLVSTPNESVSLMIVVGFEEDDVAALGETADGVPISKASMTRRFIGELIFEQANIVAVDLTATPGAVPETTQLFVSSEATENEVRAVSERFFGDAEVIIAERLTDGVDVVVVLGKNFLVQRDELLEIERAAAAEIESSDPDSEADFDVSGADAEIDGDAGGDGDDDSGEPADDPVPDTSSDTVVDDG